MNVVLKIENDAEMRAYMKDLLRGQMDTEGRREIREAVAELFEAKVKNISEQYWQQLIREAAAIAINKETAKYWDKSIKRQIIREALVAHIDDIFNGKSRQEFILECAKQLTKIP